MLCTSCFKADYTTIKQIMYIAPGAPAVVDCEFCPECGDTVFTHEQSLKLDKLRRKHPQPKLRYVIEEVQ